MILFVQWNEKYLLFNIKYIKNKTLFYNLKIKIFQWVELDKCNAGPIFLFSSGSIQWLNVQDIEMVKEIVMNTSMNLGKPSFISKDNGPLIGQGILSSSGLLWAHQRKIIAPELYLNKVKVSIILYTYSTLWSTDTDNRYNTDTDTQLAVLI